MFGNKPVIPVPRGKSSGKTTVVETCLTSAVQLSLFRRLFFFFNVYSVYIYIYCVPPTVLKILPLHRVTAVYWLGRESTAHYLAFLWILLKNEEQEGMFLLKLFNGLYLFLCNTTKKAKKKKKAKQHLQPNCSPDISHSHPF